MKSHWVLGFVLSSLAVLAAEDCNVGRFSKYTNDFFFAASSDQGAVGDIVAIDIGMTVENPREDMAGTFSVLCYDGSQLEALPTPRYSEASDSIAYLTQVSHLGEGRPGPKHPDGLSGILFQTYVHTEVAKALFPSEQSFPWVTLYFRVIGSVDTTAEIRFCDNEFVGPQNVCLRNNLFYVPREGDRESEYLNAASTRHVAGQVRILPGPPTKPDVPSLPPDAKVYAELPTRETADIRFESTGGVVHPGSTDVPVHVYVTSNYEWSGFSLAMRFPHQELEIARVEEHTRPGVIAVDNLRGFLGMIMASSRRRLGAEGEKVLIATLHVNVKAGVADASELRFSFENTPSYTNWLAIHSIGGINAVDLPVTSQVEPLQVAGGFLKIQVRDTTLGDVNLDYTVNVSDAVALLESLFITGEGVICPPAADFNVDGAVNISDPVAILRYLFLGDAGLADGAVDCTSS